MASAADTASEHSVIAVPKQQPARPPLKVAAQTRRVQLLRQALGRWIDEWGGKAALLLAETIGIDKPDGDSPPTLDDFVAYFRGYTATQMNTTLGEVEDMCELEHACRRSSGHRHKHRTYEPKQQSRKDSFRKADRTPNDDTSSSGESHRSRRNNRHTTITTKAETFT